METRYKLFSYRLLEGPKTSSEVELMETIKQFFVVCLTA